MKRYLAVMLLSTLILTACKAEVSSVYGCRGDISIFVTFNDGERVSLEIGGEKVVLNRVESESGAKYSNAEESVQLWIKGREAKYLGQGYKDSIPCFRKQG